MATALLLGAILALVTPETALAKIVGCPPGRFEVTGGEGRSAMPSGATLELSDAATVAFVGVCPPARARGRYYLIPP